MGSQSLNLANTVMKSVISLQNELDTGNLNPAGILTASGGLVNPTGSVITATTTLTDADSGKAYAIAAASATTINIPSTPGFNAKFVIKTPAAYTVTFTTLSANKIYGLKTIDGTTTSLGAGVNNVVYIARSTTAGQQQGDIINVNVINSTHTMVNAVSTGTTGAITSS